MHEKEFEGERRMKSIRKEERLREGVKEKEEKDRERERDREIK